MDDRIELARFLRGRRERLAPADAGIRATNGTRRTPGLRREEVAVLAGLSVTHYTRIEQARGARPSGQVLSALAGALRLTDDERAYLFEIARQASGAAPPASGADGALRSALRILELLPGTPATVMDMRMDVLGWNPLAAALLVDFGQLLPEHRNMVRLTFLHPELRSRYDDLELVGRETVSFLRARLPALDGDERLALLVGELTLASEEFRRHWNRREIRRKGRGRKTFTHPLVGRISLDYEALQMTGDLFLVLYTAEPGTPEHDALARLARPAHGVTVSELEGTG